MKVKWQSDAPNMELKVPSEVKIDGYIPTAEELTFTGDCSYLFAYNRFNWLLEHYPVKIVNCNNANRMFFNSTKLSSDLSKVTIQLTKCEDAAGMFSRIGTLQSLPKVEGEIIDDISSLFSSAEIQEIPDNWFDNISFSNIRRCNNLFRDSSLIKCPPLDWLENINFSSSRVYNICYEYLFYDCRQLVEITNIPCLDLLQFSGNKLSAIADGTSHLKKFTFKMNGQPVKWSNQTLALNSQVGYAGYTGDPWYYSTYNHDSAVETINSLPDTSAYLEEKGGTNTIKFKQDAGKYTDGGAIGNLTAEEIAVAAAKGWTVAFTS